MRVDTKQFLDALDSWPGFLDDHAEELVSTVTNMAFNSIVNRTPVGTMDDPHPGRARASWTVVKVNPYKYIIVSFLDYIRRLEVGWGAARTKPGMKMPIGGYAMVRNTLKLGRGFIETAAARIARRMNAGGSSFRKVA